MPQLKVFCLVWPCKRQQGWSFWMLTLGGGEDIPWFACLAIILLQSFVIGRASLGLLVDEVLFRWTFVALWQTITSVKSDKLPWVLF